MTLTTLEKKAINQESNNSIEQESQRNKNLVFMREILKKIDGKVAPKYILPNNKIEKVIDFLQVDMTKSEIESHYKLIQYLSQGSEYPMELGRLRGIEAYRNKFIRACLKVDYEFTEQERNIDIICELIKNTRCTYLALSDAKIDDKAVEAIAASLNNNKTFTKLELSGNKISDVGATAIAKMLENNSNLAVLDLKANHISNLGALAIASTFEKNTTLIALYLDEENLNEDINESIKKALRRNENLVRIRSILKKVDKSLNLLKKTTFSFEWLREAIDDKLSDINDKLKSKIQHAIRDLHTIQTQSEVDSYNLLVTLLTQNQKKLDLIGLNDRSVRYIEPLIMSFLKLADKTDSETIKKEALDSASILIKYGKLTKFTLYGNITNDARAAAIVEMLKNSSTLTELNLCENEISDAGVNVIIEALKNNSTLTRLYLSYNKISDAGAADIAEMLKNNSMLTELCLCNNKITNDGAQAILQSLECNIRLISLNIDSNGSQNIDQAILDDINDILKRNRKIAPFFAISNSIEKDDFKRVNEKAITQAIGILNAARTKQEITAGYHLFQSLHEQRNNLVNLSSEILKIYRASLIAGCLNLYEGDERREKIIAILNMSIQDQQNHPLIELLMSNLNNQDKNLLIYVIRQQLYRANDNNLPNYETISQTVSSTFPMVVAYLGKQMNEIKELEREEKIKIEEQQEKIEREEYIEKYGENRIINESPHSINSLKDKDLTDTANSLEDCLEYTHAEYARTGKIWPIVTIDQHLRTWNSFFAGKVKNNSNLNDEQKSLLYVQHARFNLKLLTERGEDIQDIKDLIAKQCNFIQNALLTNQELPDKLSKEKSLTHSIQEARTYFRRHRFNGSVPIGGSVGSLQQIFFPPPVSMEENNDEVDSIYGKNGIYEI